MNFAERLAHLRTADNTRRSSRHTILLVAKVAITMALMLLAFRSIDFRMQDLHWSSLHLGHFAAACAAIAFGQLLAAWRWVIILRKWDIRLSIGEAYRLNLVGMFFNIVFPTSVGGDAVRVLLLGRRSGLVAESIMSVFLTRLLGILVLLAIGLLAGFAFAWTILPGWVLPGVIAVVIVSMGMTGYALRSERVGHWAIDPRAGAVGKARHAVGALQLIGADPALLARVLAISLAIQLVSIHSNWEAALAIGVRTHYLYFLAFMPLATAITMVPVSIFGLGLRENAFVFLFRHVGVDPTAAVSMSLAWLIAYLVVSFLGGLFLLTLDDSFFVRREPARMMDTPIAEPVREL